MIRKTWIKTMSGDLIQHIETLRVKYDKIAKDFAVLESIVLNVDADLDILGKDFYEFYFNFGQKLLDMRDLLNPNVGDKYYNQPTRTIYVWNGTNWISTIEDDHHLRGIYENTI